MYTLVFLQEWEVIVMFLIQLTVEEPEELSSRRTLLEQSLQEVLFQIIKFVNEKKDHVPPINDGVIYCPFEITFPRYTHTACLFT